jgi:hypothetical protein
MKKFCFNFIAFILLLFVFNIIIYNFTKSIKYYAHYEVLPNTKFKSFLFSDSHGGRLGKKTERFNTYNFSAGSDSYFDIERKLKFLIHENYQIDTIFLSFDDHMLNTYRENTNNKDRSSYYLTHLDFNNKFEYINSRYIKYYFPIIQPKIRSLFRLMMYNKIKKNQTNSSKESWANLPLNIRKRKAQKRKQKHFSSNATSNSLKYSLERIILLCKMHKINLLGIKFPLSATYIEALNGNNYEVENVFLKNYIPLLDYKSLFINNSNYFYNQDHLNNTGAEILVNTIFKK